MYLESSTGMYFLPYHCRRSIFHVQFSSLLSSLAWYSLCWSYFKLNGEFISSQFWECHPSEGREENHCVLTSILGKEKKEIEDPTTWMPQLFTRFAVSISIITLLNFCTEMKKLQNYNVVFAVAGCEQRPCQNGGTCVNGTCICHASYSGPFCSIVAISKSYLSLTLSFIVSEVIY